jgi:hypothetical protein
MEEFLKMEAFLKDVAHSLRPFRRSPGFKNRRCGRAYAGHRRE